MRLSSWISGKRVAGKGLSQLGTFPFRALALRKLQRTFGWHQRWERGCSLESVKSIASAVIPWKKRHLSCAQCCFLGVPCSKSLKSFQIRCEYCIFTYSVHVEVLVGNLQTVIHFLLPRSAIATGHMLNWQIYVNFGQILKTTRIWVGNWVGPIFLVVLNGGGVGPV